MSDRDRQSSGLNKEDSKSGSIFSTDSKTLSMFSSNKERESKKEEEETLKYNSSDSNRKTHSRKLFQSESFPLEEEMEANEEYFINEEDYEDPDNEAEKYSTADTKSDYGLKRLNRNQSEKTQIPVLKQSEFDHFKSNFI